jgi:hypothetical protein
LQSACPASGPRAIRTRFSFTEHASPEFAVGPFHAASPLEIRFEKENDMSLGLILLIVLLLAALSSAPVWPYSTRWGYYPSGGLGLAVLVVIVLVLMGRI